jgi:hypothetical protein
LQDGRDDYLNRVSRNLIENQDLIAAENLQVRNMPEKSQACESDSGLRLEKASYSASGKGCDVREGMYSCTTAVHDTDLFRMRT